MRRVVAFVLVFAMVAQVSPLVASGLAKAGQATGSISGSAINSGGQPLANATVQLRNLSNGQLAATTTSDAAGQYSFAGLTPGNYAVELVNPAGEIVGTSASIAVSAGRVATGVSVTASAGAGVGTAAAGGAAAAGLSTGAIVGIVAAAGGIATIIAVKATGSSSR